jgi:HPt (histidine-containing phosphotransfer) domain-containing protein
MDTQDHLAMLDRVAALEGAGGDLQLLQEIALLFLEEYPKLLAEIRQAAKSGNARLLERAAHSLKGSVATFGARLVCDTAYEIERLARQGDVASAACSLEKLQWALDRLHPELKELCATRA